MSHSEEGGEQTSAKSSSRSEANPNPEHCGCLLVLREMVPRGHRLHLPLADEVQGQADREHADAGRGSHGEADQHDQHSLAVSLGTAQEGRGTRAHPTLTSLTTSSWRAQTSPSSQALPSELQLSLLCATTRRPF